MLFRSLRLGDSRFGAPRWEDEVDEGIEDGEDDMGGDDDGTKEEEGEGADAEEVLEANASCVRPLFDAWPCVLEVEEDVGKGGVEVERGGCVGHLSGEGRRCGEIAGEEGRGEGSER